MRYILLFQNIIMQNISPIHTPHQPLTDQIKSEFTELYFSSEPKYHIFMWMKKSKMNMILWTIFVITFMSFLSYFTRPNIILKFILFCIGILSIQLVFIIEHMACHALFLKYNYDELFKYYSEFFSKSPFYFYEFYHHHHSQDDDWMRALSFNDTKKSFILDRPGTKNIIAAYWNEFSFLSSWILMILLFHYICPISIFYFFGFEVGVLILPFAHCWQHVEKECFGIMKYLLYVLEFIGFVAKRNVHDKHHNYTSDVVYQEFSSSGFYSVLMNRFFSGVWKEAYFMDLPAYDCMEWLSNLARCLGLFAVPMIVYGFTY